MFPGGIADKLGNRFEAKWAVQKLIEVFLGQAHAIRFESINPSDHGVEFSLSRGQNREWHQTKRQETNGNWTVRRLETEGVLSSALSKLETSADDFFVFVSESPAKGLHNLPGKATIAQNWQEFDAGLSDEQRKEFTALNRVWKTKPEQAWLYIRRCRFEVVSDTSLDSQNRLLSGVTFNEQLSLIFPILRDYLESNFNRELGTEDVRKELIGSSLITPRASYDPTLGERVTQANQRYLQSYTPFGAGGETLPRTEAKAVIDHLSKEDGPKVILLTGSAGAGKSGVVREVISALAERGFSHLSFRVDRNLTVRSTSELGQTILGRYEDPVISLASIKRDETAVLIIDQIDAVSEASGRVGPMREVIFELINTARMSRFVRVLAICRSFDLTNDQTLRTMEQGHGVCRVEVKTLDWEREVKPLLVKKGINIERITVSQSTLLTLPLNLNLFLEVFESHESAATFTSTTDLFSLLVERKQRSIRERGYVDISISNVIAVLANSMSREQLLDAPVGVLDVFPNALDILAAEQLIVRTSNRVAFFHESLFDFAFSRSFVAEGRRIIEFLHSDEQFLFRRTQVRQILTAYRQGGNTPRYLSELKDVLTSTEVRYHLKDGVVRWLTILDDPFEGELDIVLSLDRPDDGMPPLVRMALYPQAGWFPLLMRREFISAWLNSTNEARRRDVLNILRNVANKYPDDVANILRTWWSDDEGRAKELLQWFSWLGDHGPNAPLLGLYLELIRSKPTGFFDEHGSFDRHSLALASWIKNDPIAASEILRVWYETWFELYPDRHPFESRHSNDHDNYWLEELRKKSPAAFLDAVVSAFAKTISRIRRTYDGEHWHDWTWHVRREKDSYGADAFLGMMKSSLTDIAISDPQRAANYLTQIDPASHPAALLLHLETIASNGEALGKMLPSYLEYKSLLEAGYTGAEWISFARAAKSSIPYLSADERNSIYSRILKHREELKHAEEIAAALKKGEPKNDFWNHQAVIHYLNWSGYEQWCILKTLGPGNLSGIAKERLSLLDRKFHDKNVASPSAIQGGFVPPPIVKDRAKLMTDDQWLRALSKYSKSRAGFREDGKWVFHSGSSGLAQVLQEQTKDDPDRFIRFLLRLPSETPADYILGILSGLAESNASRDVLKTAVQYADSQTARPFGSGICRILQKHPYLAKDDQVFEALIWYVINGDAATEGESEEKRVEQEVLTVEHILQTGSALMIRGAYGDRGAAAETLGAVIWECSERLDRSVEVLSQRVVIEPLRSIRCCLTQAIYSVLRYDNKRSAELLRRLIVRDDGLDLTPLMTHYGLNSLYYILHGSPEIGKELLEYLLTSQDQGQRLIGAFHLFREAYYDQAFAQRADVLIPTGDVYRKLAADAAANHIARAEYRLRAEQQLLQYFNDPLKEVRVEAANCFRHIEADKYDIYRPLLRAFIQSRAFESENFSFFLFLKEARDTTAEEVILASERLLELISIDTKQSAASEMHYLDDLILREYAAVADRPELKKRLLNVIDRMLILGLYGTEQIIKEHERG